MKAPDKSDFPALLTILCDQDTTQDPAGWTSENPLHGHCAVVAVKAQEFFGGDLLRSSLLGTPFASMGSHYWNILPDGVEMDFTAGQFCGSRPLFPDAEIRSREYVLYDPRTGEQREIFSRYKLLSWRIARTLSNENPLFDDDTYRCAYFAALDSRCQKMKFGCVIKRSGLLRYVGHNDSIPELRSLCQPTCIRHAITSRTESMLGACGHAEEHALWYLSRKLIPTTECELYVAGVHMNGLPWLKTENVHTCLRCAVQMHHAGLKSVHVPVVDHWESLTTSEALETARAYAMQEKKV